MQKDVTITHSYVSFVRTRSTSRQHCINLSSKYRKPSLTFNSCNIKSCSSEPNCLLFVQASRQSPRRKIKSSDLVNKIQSVLVSCTKRNCHLQYPCVRNVLLFSRNGYFWPGTFRRNSSYRNPGSCTASYQLLVIIIIISLQISLHVRCCQVWSSITLQQPNNHKMTYDTDGDLGWV